MEYSNLQKAIIASSLINTIFCEYEAGELNKSSELVRSRIAKFMRQRSKKNKYMFKECIFTTDKAWRSAIKHYNKQNIQIEAKATISHIFNQFSDELSKFANVRHEHIEKMMIDTTENYEAEMNSDMVMDFIFKELGLEVKKSAFSGKFLTLKNNLIADRKNIDARFM